LTEDLQAKVVAAYRAAMKRRQSPQMAFEQAVTIITDREPTASRADARRRVGRMLAGEEGYDARLFGLTPDAADEPRRPHPLFRLR
jgi:hypothetical protein